MHSSIDLPDFDTAIIPAICVGNAAQMACDLLIASKRMKMVGTLLHPALIPVFGPSAYQHEPEKRAAACEFHFSEEDRLLVIQFRSPLISTHATALHRALREITAKAKCVIILTASFGFEKHDVGGSPYAYCATEEFLAAHNEQLQKVDWKKFEGDVIFGGGNGMALYKKLKSKKRPVLLLLRYVLEGDNAADAKSIVRELQELYGEFLNMGKKDGQLELVVPVSWNLLFGNDATEFVF